MLIVTAAVMRRADAFFVARRAPGRRLAGYWEFPGGKVQAGETPEAALARELREELGIDARIGACLHVTEHHADGPPLQLRFYGVIEFVGEIALRDHDDARWLRPGDMLLETFAPADREFVRRLWSAAHQPSHPKRAS